MVTYTESITVHGSLQTCRFWFNGKKLALPCSVLQAAPRSKGLKNETSISSNAQPLQVVQSCFLGWSIMPDKQGVSGYITRITNRE